MLSYLEINLFSSPAQSLVNTVNTVGVMGKGIAFTFKQLYPEMFNQYRELCQRGYLDIGKLYIYRTPNKIIVNFPTKKHWRQPSNIEYIEAGLKKFVERYTDYGISSVSFPQLGCGNGELDWENQVQPIMEYYLKPLPIPVYIHIYNKPSNFVPERLDLVYAREMQLERQRISIDDLWIDLENIVNEISEASDYPNLITNISGEGISFAKPSQPPLRVYREEVENLWDILRLRGTLREDEIAETLHETELSHLFFQLLARLKYVKEIKIRSVKDVSAVRGLVYSPLPITYKPKQPEIIL